MGPVQPHQQAILPVFRSQGVVQGVLLSGENAVNILQRYCAT
jgi:hypothetical protein